MLFGAGSSLLRRISLQCRIWWFQRCLTDSWDPVFCMEGFPTLTDNQTGMLACYCCGLDEFASLLKDVVKFVHWIPVVFQPLGTVATCVVLHLTRLLPSLSLSITATRIAHSSLWVDDRPQKKEVKIVLHRWWRAESGSLCALPMVESSGSLFADSTWKCSYLTFAPRIWEDILCCFNVVRRISIGKRPRLSSPVSVTVAWAQCSLHCSTSDIVQSIWLELFNSALAHFNDKAKIGLTSSKATALLALSGKKSGIRRLKLLPHRGRVASSCLLAWQFVGFRCRPSSIAHFLHLLTPAYAVHPLTLTASPAVVEIQWIRWWKLIIIAKFALDRRMHWPAQPYRTEHKCGCEIKERNLLGNHQRQDTDRKKPWLRDRTESIPQKDRRHSWFSSGRSCCSDEDNTDVYSRTVWCIWNFDWNIPRTESSRRLLNPQGWKTEKMGRKILYSNSAQELVHSLLVVGWRLNPVALD